MEGMFKTAVSGFKKDEVLAYIDKRETEARQKQESLSQRLRKMTADLNEEKAQHTEALEQLKQLEKELDRERTRADDLAKSAGTSEEEKRALKAQLNDAQFEIARLRQELDAAHKERDRTAGEQETAHMKIAELENAVGELNDKLTHSTKTEDLISRVLLEAQTTADKILTEARENAAKEVAEAEEKSAFVLDKAKGELAELLEETAQFRSEVSELREGTQRAFSHIDTLLGNVELSAGHFQETYQIPFQTEQEEPPAQEETELSGSQEAAADTQDVETASDSSNRLPEESQSSHFDFSHSGE